VTAAAPTPLAVAVRRGVRLFNRGRYMAAQELWEVAWREAPPEDRGFLEGLVQLAAALHLRTRRGATRGATNLLARAMGTLADYGPAAHGVDVEALVVDFTAFLDWLRALGRPHRLVDRLRIPRIRETGTGDAG
jgi:predicted metal-dependent hydrolase